MVRIEIASHFNEKQLCLGWMFWQIWMQQKRLLKIKLDNFKWIWKYLILILIDFSLRLNLIICFLYPSERTTLHHRLFVCRFFYFKLNEKIVLEIAKTISTDWCSSLNCNTIPDDDYLDSNWNYYSKHNLDWDNDYCNYSPNLVRLAHRDHIDFRIVEWDYNHWIDVDDDCSQRWLEKHTNLVQNISREKPVQLILLEIKRRNMRSCFMIKSSLVNARACVCMYGCFFSLPQLSVRFLCSCYSFSLSLSPRVIVVCIRKKKVIERVEFSIHFLVLSMFVDEDDDSIDFRSSVDWWVSPMNNETSEKNGWQEIFLFMINVPV